MPSLAEFIDGRRARVEFEAIKLDKPIALVDLPTPALVIDLDVFEKNLKRMQSFLSGHGLGLRCHTKMHKCPVIAHQQIAQGAIGVCTAKVSEAEIMQAAGVLDILITSPVSTPDKGERVVGLAGSNDSLKIVVDCIETATALNSTATKAGCTVGVFIDLDPGMGRTGIEPLQPALALGRHIRDACPALRFDGLQMYAGNCMHITEYEERKATYARLMEKGRQTREMFEADGISVPVFSGGGTGSYDMESELGILTEVQAGSYAFMDIEYRDIASRTGPQFDDFPPSLFVLVSAISKPQEELITVDAGFKCLASDKSAPEFREIEGVVYQWGGDEHGIIELNNPSRQIALGDKLEVITPHCDPTVNLHDFFFPYRNGVVEEIWPISARGCSQ
jgi:D-serine deaminase-like pyridoxal phosphate-dependent protein